MVNKAVLFVAAGVLLLVLGYTGLYTADRTTWLMEVAPVLVALPLLAATHRRAPLTPLLYWLIFIHALILILGGFYTYAKVPLGFWLQDYFNLGRNPYDKIGHFAQGFVPALVAREILLHGCHVAGRRMAGFLSLCVAMAISAWYELIEWGAAVALGQGADEFLGTQGDPWDTQSDMGMAMLGASVALLLFTRWHDSQLERLPLAHPPSGR